MCLCKEKKRINEKKRKENFHFRISKNLRGKQQQQQQQINKYSSSKNKMSQYFSSFFSECKRELLLLLFGCLIVEKHIHSFVIPLNYIYLCRFFLFFVLFNCTIEQLINWMFKKQTAKKLLHII